MEFLKVLQEKLGEEVFTEEFQDQLKAEIDVLISEKVLAEKETIKEALEVEFEAKKVELEESLRKEADEYKSELTESIDGYLDYATKEFFAENKVAIENEYAVKTAKELIEAFATVLENNHFSVDLDQTKKEEVLESKIDQLETKYKKMVKENIELKTDVSEYEKSLKFCKLTEGLSKIKVDKVLKLTEGMDFKDLKDFERKVKICIEKLTDKKDITEDKEVEDLKEKEVVTESKVSKYFEN